MTGNLKLDLYFSNTYRAGIEAPAVPYNVSLVELICGAPATNIGATIADTRTCGCMYSTNLGISASFYYSVQYPELIYTIDYNIIPQFYTEGNAESSPVQNPVQSPVQSRIQSRVQSRFYNFPSCSSCLVSPCNQTEKLTVDYK